ncbi:acyl transferase, partial [Lepidopterella palustris CBS 459.81]
ASLSVRPDIVVGYSLGEYAALHVAGIISASEAIFLVGKSAKILQARCQVGSHKMLAVRASVKQIEQITFKIVCINRPKEIVFSGPVAEISALVPILKANGYKCYTLDVAFAFHSAQTDPMLDKF